MCELSPYAMYITLFLLGYIAATVTLILYSTKGE